MYRCAHLSVYGQRKGWKYQMKQIQKCLMKQKISASSQIYQNIPVETGPFSAYNCCANKTIPNSPSADCTPANGFPFSIPKWACPINPGEGDFNMCSVKSYACELSVCMKQL